MATIANLGSNTGLIYVTNASGTVIVSAYRNGILEVINVLRNARSMRGVANHADSANLNETNYRYFLNDLGSATKTSLTGAIEITDWFVGRGLDAEAAFEQVSVVGDSITIERRANIQFVTPIMGDSTGIDAIVSEDIHVEGDVIVFLGRTSADPITLVDTGTNNIDGDFLLDDEKKSIWLRYDGTNWNELSRNPSTTSVSVSQLRANGASINGATANNVNITNGGTLEVDPAIDSRFIVLSSASLVGLTTDFTLTAATTTSGDSYVVRVEADYLKITGDINLFGTDITGTIVPLNTSSTKPATVHCYYDGAAWNFTCTLDIDRYLIDTDENVIAKYQKGLYSFATQGGAASTFVISPVIPSGSVVDLENVIILCKTALTSGATPTIAIGLGADADAIDNFRPFSALPYTTVNAAQKAVTTIGSKLLYLASPQSITLTISGATLTAGVVEVYVPYVNIP